MADSSTALDSMPSIESRDVKNTGAGRPMTYAYYHEVIKGSAPKNAPTYREEPPAQPQPASGHVYKCDVCGYTVESDGPLPDDFVCPICGVDRSHFKEI